MLAGRKAFRGDSITALLFKIITEEPPALRELDPTVPEGMIRLLEKALAKSPDARYPDRPRDGRRPARADPALVDADDALDRRADAAARDAADDRASAHRGRAGHVAPASPRPRSRSRRAAPRSRRPHRRLPATVLTPPPAAAALHAGADAARGHARSRPPAAARHASGRSGPGAGLVLGLLGVGLVVRGRRSLPAAGGSSSTRSAVTNDGDTPATRDAAPRRSRRRSRSGTPATAWSPSPTRAPAIPAAGGRLRTPEPEPTAGAFVASTGSRPGRRPVRGLPPRTAAPAGGPAAGGRAVRACAQHAPPPSDYRYLNEVPAQGPDGRELGEAAARSYSSGGRPAASAAGVSRQRPRVPRDVAPEERPAVATLLHVAFARAGLPPRQRPLRDAARAQGGRPAAARRAFPERRLRARALPLRAAGRAGGNEFKITATPLIAARPFYTDDNGFVLVDE